MKARGERMRRTGAGRLRAGSRTRRAAWAAALVLVVGLAVAAAAPTAQGAARLAVRLAAAVKSLPRRAPSVPPALLHGRLFDGTPAVGALFTTSAGRLGQHFCTASVVHSPVRDLLITAAHCMSADRVTDGVDFVPAYHNGHAPYGVWTVTQVIVDQAWASSADPNDDVAFLVVTQAGNPARIQDQTGGEQLGIGWGPAQHVRVIGYPDTRKKPIRCRARTRAFGRHQMEFDCGGYTNGTSGGPFLARVSPATGRGSVIGVIGGYEQGGDTPSVSYSARFGGAVAALYQEAISRG